MPEIKKIQDIAIREKKSMGIKDEAEPAQENEDDTNDRKRNKKLVTKQEIKWQGPKFCSELYT